MFVFVIHFMSCFALSTKFTMISINSALLRYIKTYIEYAMLFLRCFPITLSLDYNLFYLFPGFCGSSQCRINAFLIIWVSG